MASSTSWIKNLDVIDDLPSLLDRLLSLQAAENKPRPVQYAFRGVANKTWSLTPSVSRIPGINHTASGLRIERQQIENFRRDAWRFLGPFERQFLNITLTDLVRTKPLDHKLKWESEGIWSALAIARHYGAPTRLLDWTHNVLFAAYFAACSEPEMDGAIWWFDQTEFETVVADMWDSWGVNIRDDGSKQRAIELSAFVPDAAPWISKVHHDVPFTRMERQKGF
ncbi:MAG TPA: FRG domain-containing protein, partial [Tepidisphaeraceae bacterium]